MNLMSRLGKRLRRPFSDFPQATAVIPYGTTYVTSHLGIPTKELLAFYQFYESPLPWWLIVIR